MKNKRTNVVFSLRNREIRNNTRVRNDFRILQTLIVHTNREFKKVWSKQSTKMFTYEGGFLFSDNHRIGYTGYSINGGFKEQYRLPPVETGCKNKIEEILIYKCYHENFQKFENKASFIGILSRRMGESLVQYNLDTGQLLREIFLSNTVKFKHISWVEGNEMFVVKSVNTAARSRFHMVTGIPVNVAIVMAVFKAFPLEFVGMFEVDRRIFGPGITSAILSHNLLIVMHINGFVKFYSLTYIIENFKVSDHSIDGDRRCPSIDLEDFPYSDSLPLNIKITECPPVLFEVKCADHDVQIGGFPWHYIFTPYRAQGTFSVYCIKDGKKAKNGTLQTQCMQTEPDRCVFHDDNSGRIVHISSPNIRILEIKSEEDSEKAEIVPVKSVSLKQELKEDETPFTVTSSGRLIRRRQSLEEIDFSRDLVIHQMQYEDELDLTWVSATHNHPSIREFVSFYDNRTFDLLREIKLSEHGEETYQNVTYVDLDTIIQIHKCSLRKFVCSVYRLSGDQQPDLDKARCTESSEHNVQNNSDRMPRTRRR